MTNMERIKGIVLRQVKFGENKQIVDLFTESRGRISIIASAGARSMTASQKQGGSRRRGSAYRLMPLSMVEFDCDIHGQDRLPYPHGITPYYIYCDIQFNPLKSALIMFVAEFLQNALKEEGANPILFKYIQDSLQWLDGTSQPVCNFHIVFLLQMTRFLGISPNLDGYSPVLFYDLMNTEYRYGQPPHQHFLRPDEAKVLPYICNMRQDNSHLYRFTREQRHRILEVMNDYYRIHLPSFKELKSLDVLREVFD